MSKSCEPKKALIVDDHPLVRYAMSKAINAEPDLSVCGEAGGADEAMRLIHAAMPDVVLVDLSLPGTTGFDLLRDIQAQHPQLPTLVLSMHDGLTHAARAFRAEARGYVTKTEDVATILQAIRRVLSGKMWIPEKILPSQIGFDRDGQAVPPEDVGEGRDDATPGSQAGGLPLVHLGNLAEHSLTLSKLVDLFRATTGLDAFLCFRDQKTRTLRERGLTNGILLPQFCQVVQRSPEGLARCSASHEKMMKRAVGPPSLTRQHCHIGLATFHCPVFVLGAGPGDIQTVCALDDAGTRLESSDLHRNISDSHLSKEEALEAIHDLRTVSQADTGKVLEWLGLLANCLSETAGPPLGEEDEPALGAEPPMAGAPAEERRIRYEVGRFVALPRYRGNRSCGRTPVVIDRVVAFLKEHYSLPLSTQVVSLALGFEPSYFAKAFKRYAKESMVKCLRRIRLEQAKRLLSNPYLSVLEIADRTGFSDASYFSRVFHSDLGMTPKQYRRLIGQSPPLVVSGGK